jgi:hypothetical protein
MKAGSPWRWLAALAVLTGALASAASAAPARHALLIGIDDYTGTNLRSLEGPVNDVALVRELLEARFQVPRGNILTLRDAQATHSGIRKAFADLAARVGPGDFVYIQYSGHGSYTPDQNGDEPLTGQDQTWVSYGARAGRLAGDDDVDVIDDEIIEWLIPIYEKTDQVVFVSDSCHSASVSRGELRGVRSAEPDKRPHPLAGKAFRRWRAGEAPGVRVGAARDTESAVEIARAGKSYGLFTWFWVESLDAARPGETWEEAFRRTYTLVTTERRAFQRPQLEGEGKRAVFGGQFQAPLQSVPVVRVDAGAGLVELRVGAVNGATAGSVYRLYRPGEPEGAPRAEAPSLELTRVRPYLSEARVRAGSFQVGDLVVEAEHAYPFEPLRLAVEGDFAKDKDRPLVERLAQMVQGLEGFALAPDRAGADWVLYVLRPRRSDAGYGYEAKATLPASDRALPPEVWVVSPQEELLSERLRIPLEAPDAGIGLLEENLRKLARLQEVKRLASRTDPAPIAVSVTQLRPVERCEGDCVPFPDERGEERPHARLGSHRLGQLPEVRPRRGDVLTFAVTNAGNRDYYVYLLNLTPDGAIHAVFPLPSQAQEHARLAVGKTRDLSAETGLLLNAPGQETVKVIASAEPIDVRLFEMQGYAAYKRTRGAALNPLERLLAEAMGTRGAVVSLREADWGTLQVEFPVTD